MRKIWPLANLVDPRFARRNFLAVHGVGWIQLAFHDSSSAHVSLIGSTVSVRVNPRSFSGRERRQAIVAVPAGGTLRMESCTGLGAYCGLGSSGCGQVLSTVRTFISARNSTYPPGCELPALELHAAILVDGNAAEEIHVGHQVARAQAPFAEFHQEAVAAVAVTLVAALLVTALAVFRAQPGRRWSSRRWGRASPRCRRSPSRARGPCRNRARSPAVRRAMCCAFSVSGML